MKKESMSDEILGKGMEGGYINHGLCHSGLDLSKSNGASEFYSISNEKSEFAEIQGSSDFVLVNEPDSDGLGSCIEKTKQRFRSAVTKKNLYKRLPILRWLPRYDSDDAIGDLVAGITVGLTVIPQSLAYSNVAGLDAKYGLYGSFLGCFIYIIFGSCKDVPVGPTAIVSLLTYQTVRGLPRADYHAMLLCFFAGIIELLMGIFGLGFLIDFVSGPVSSGFTSAVALIIVSSQIKDVLGITAGGSTFTQIWDSILENAHKSQLWDITMGISCIILLLFLRFVATISIGPKDEHMQSTKEKLVNKFLWLIGTSRNALLVVLCGSITYILKGAEKMADEHILKTDNNTLISSNNTFPYQLIAKIPAGLPAVQFPPFGFTDSGTTVTFFDMVHNLGNGILVLPLISIMENIAICKAFSNGKTVDASQELIAIGLSNVGNSFVQAFPGSGSLSRSAVNNASGVRTPLGGLYTGILVIFALIFLTPYFSYIPKATLAAIIIAAVIFMVEVKVIKPMWRTKKSDLIPGIGTFIACLVLRLELGIAIGIGLNIIFILYHAARPKISIEKLKSKRGVEYIMLTPDRCLIFPSVDYVRNLVTKYSQRLGNGSTPVVIDCSHIYGADYTAAKVIESLINDFASRGQPLFFYNLKPSVYAVFDGVSPTDFISYYTEEALDDLLKQRASIAKQIYESRIP